MGGYDVDSVMSFESFRALKLSNSESFRTQKISLLETLRLIKFYDRKTKILIFPPNLSILFNISKLRDEPHDGIY